MLKAWPEATINNVEVVAGQSTINGCLLKLLLDTSSADNVICIIAECVQSFFFFSSMRLRAFERASLRFSLIAHFRVLFATLFAFLFLFKVSQELGGHLVLSHN